MLEHRYYIVYYFNTSNRGKLGSIEINRARKISNADDIAEITAIIKDKLNTKEVVVLNVIKLKPKIRWWYE